MMLVWDNCALYNKHDSPVGRAGSRASARFEELWAQSGFTAHVRTALAAPSGPC